MSELEERLEHARVNKIFKKVIKQVGQYLTQNRYRYDSYKNEKELKILIKSKYKEFLILECGEIQ